MAMLFWYNPKLQTKHSDTWNKLKEAWENTFCRPLTETEFQSPPSTGKHAFKDFELSWLSGTLRYLTAQQKASRKSARDKSSRQPIDASDGCESGGPGSRKRGKASPRSSVPQDKSHGEKKKIGIEECERPILRYEQT